MAIKRLTLENFTVFEKIQIPFTPGVNVIIGENGTGKTHVMKVLYSACQAARPDISFSHKLVRVSKWEEHLSSLTSTFIPAKEILSNAWNLEAAVNMNNVDFDDTYVDIVTAAKIDISAGKDSSKRKKLLNILQKITTGTVLFTDEKFYLRSNGKIEFSLVAEGIRKIALLWQLIKNGTLEQGSVLFWDEPEANINPSHVPVLVEMLLELQRNGVQIFISTHDYVFSKYFEVRRKPDDQVMFYCFHSTESGVQVDRNAYFNELKENAILRTYDRLMDEIFSLNSGE